VAVGVELGTVELVGIDVGEVLDDFRSACCYIKPIPITTAAMTMITTILL